MANISMYNLTNLTGDPINLLLNVNAQVSGIFGAGLLFSLFAIIFLVMSKTNKGSVSILVASFVTFISSLMLAPTGLIEVNWVFAPLLIMVLSAFFVYRDNTSYDV